MIWEQREASQYGGGPSVGATSGGARERELRKGREPPLALRPVARGLVLVPIRARAPVAGGRIIGRSQVAPALVDVNVIFNYQSMEGSGTDRPRAGARPHQ